MIIPLVIGFQICFFLKNDIALANPAMNNRMTSIYSTIKPIFCIAPNRCINVVSCPQYNECATSIIIYNANKVPIIRKVPSAVL